MRQSASALATVVAGLALACTATGVATAAETAELTASGGKFFELRKRVAIPAYHLNFITQQQATSVATLDARTRLNTVLAGVDEATMRKLADEAHADLVAQLKSAGIDVVPDAEAAALIGPADRVPGNGDAKGVGAGITIGKSLKRGYAAYGAAAAPLAKAFHDPASATGATGFAAMGIARKAGDAAKAMDAVAVVPVLTIDYVDMETSTGRDFLGRAKAAASAELAFSLRSTSNAVLMSAYNSGPGFMLGMRLKQDVKSTAPFARVIEGGAEVREGSMVPIADQNHVVRDRARGDAVVVDLPVWEGLVRDAYRGFNAALVAGIQKERK